MTRRLAGVYDPRGRPEASRLHSAFSQEAAVLDRGRLCLAFSGPPAAATEPLCLLDGYLDNAAALARSLGLAPQEPPEALLAAGWRRWGRSLPTRLRGDFLVLVWDAERREGLLARDQLGVRSLFMFERDGVLSFAGEMRDLLALLPCRPAPDPLGVAHWVAGVGRGAPDTLFAGVHRLQPGSLVYLDADGANERRYWSPRFREPIDRPPSELTAEVAGALAASVKRRLDPRGTTGVLMSGGLDSGAVAAFAAGQAPGAVAAYSGVFPEHPSLDESELIAQLRSALRLSGATAEVRAGGLLASALDWQRTWQVPLLGWGEFWTLPLLRHAGASGCAVVLGGDGGDELFATRGALIADRLCRGRVCEALRLTGQLPGAGSAPALGALLAAISRIGVRGALAPTLHGALRRPLRRRDVPAWLRPRTARQLAATIDPVAWKRHDGPRWWAQGVDLLTSGVEQLGVFETLRRSGAQAGVQLRHPLFDLELLELILRQSPAASFDAHLDRPLLRRATRALLPDAIRLRRSKALFDPLIIDSLLGCDGVAVRALLSDPQAELCAFVDLPAARSALLADGQRHPFMATQYLWRLVTAECWLRAQSDPGAGVLPPGITLSPARVEISAT